jgi:murein DD-endopeptidase MepM/ murein hydrolase activator NlpD
MGCPSPATLAYFAEGTTRNGFEEYLVLRNPLQVSTIATVSCLFQAPGKTKSKVISLAPGAGASVCVNDMAGADRDVSLVVEARPGIVAERQIYFNYKGVWTGGHVTAGAAAPNRTWYFAEGATRAGFAEWLCIQNPGFEPVNAVVTFMLGGGENIRRTVDIAARSRVTLDVNAAVGPEQDVSMAIEASGPVVAERPMYFDYKGAWRGGHTATGATRLSREWDFAEGSTRAGFEEWLCIENPGADTTAVVDYMFADGASISRSYGLRGHARTTLFVNREVGPERDVSIRVRGTGDILCERPMYFLYHGRWEGGHVVMGCAGGRKTWYFPTAAVDPSFESWLCLSNPADGTNIVDVDLLGKAGGSKRVSFSMEPYSRRTLDLDSLAAGLDDPWVRVNSSGALVAERPTYFSYQPKIEPRPFTLATWNGIELKSPISYPDLLGCVYHEASPTASDGGPSNAQVLQPVGICLRDDNPGRRHPAISLTYGNDPAYFIEGTRYRGSYSTTACDVQANAGSTVYSPVSGTVLKAGGYMLYGKYPDLRVYILIDGFPGYYAAVFHMDTLSVSVGQRVEAGRTPIGTVRNLMPYFYQGPNPYTRAEGNHAHVEIEYNQNVHL